MGYSLGIDLGTTFSAAATIDDDARLPTMVGLGNRAAQVPSVVFFREDGSIVVGEQAEHLAPADPIHLVREFKRRTGDKVPYVIAGRPYAPEEITAQLLRWVVDQTTERLGRPPTKLILTHPASWTRNRKVEKLHEAAASAGLKNISTCPEPIAAAMNYANTNRVEVGDRICVYDLGGGSFDVSVLARTADGFKILSNSAGDSLLGGIEFDKVIMDKIMKGLPQLFDAAQGDPGLLRFQRDCVDAKESLSVDVATVVPVTLAGTTTTVRLTRVEFEGMIDSMLADTIRWTRVGLASAGVEVADLRSVVLVGGSSRIPLVTEKLTSSFRCCTIARNAHPEYEVALGAALVGRALCRKPMTSPAQASRTKGPITTSDAYQSNGHLLH